MSLNSENEFFGDEPENLTENESLPTPINDRQGDSIFDLTSNRRGFLAYVAKLTTATYFYTQIPRDLSPEQQILTNSAEGVDPNDLDSVFAYAVAMNELISPSGGEVGLGIPRFLAKFLNNPENFFVPETAWQDTIPPIDFSEIEKDSVQELLAMHFIDYAEKLFGSNAKRLIGKVSLGPNLGVSESDGLILPTNIEGLMNYLAVGNQMSFLRLVGHEFGHLMNNDFNCVKSIPTYRVLKAYQSIHELNLLVPFLFTQEKKLESGISFSHAIDSGGWQLLNAVKVNYATVGNGVSLPDLADPLLQSAILSIVDFVKGSNVEYFDPDFVNSIGYRHILAEPIKMLFLAAMNDSLKNSNENRSDFALIMQEIMPSVMTEIVADLVATTIFQPKLIDNDQYITSLVKNMIAAYSPQFNFSSFRFAMTRRIAQVYLNK